MGRTAKAGWRKHFLKALARTGNAALSARMARIDKGTAYNLRQRDMGFARDWVRAKRFAQGRVERVKPSSVPANTPPPPFGRSCPGADGRRPSAARPGDGRPDHSRSGDGEAPGRSDFVVRYNKREGAQLVRAGRGRFSERVRARFSEALKATGNVRAAAAAAGISTTAMYNRRKRYPLLEAEWAADRERGCRSVSLMLIDAAEAALDPELDAEAMGVPKVSVAEAIAILRLHKFDEAGAPTHAGARAQARARGQAVEDMPIEAVREEILRRVAAIRGHEAGDRGAEHEGGAAGGCGQLPLHPLRGSPSPSADGEAE